MKKLYLLSLLLLCFWSAMAQSTLNTTYGSNVICPNTLFQVSYSDASTTYQPGNVFTVQLSNATGSFASPTTVGSLQSAAGSGTINASIFNITPGTGYRLRVVSSSPQVIGNNNGSNITVSSLPNVAITPASSNICQGQSIALTASGADTYSWDAWPQISSLSATTGPVVTAAPTVTNYYTVMGTNNLGCMNAEVAVVNVTQAALGVNSNQPVCPGGTLTLFAWNAGGTTASNFAWTGPNGFSATGATVDIPNLQPSHYGTYTVTALVGNCTATNTIQVGPPAGPAIFTNPTVCPGATIYLAADSLQQGATYSWVGPNGFTSTQMNPEIPNASSANSGTYTVYSVFATCTSEPSTAQVTVSPTLSVSATATAQVNQGGVIVLQASGSGGTYQWTGPNGYTATGNNPYITNAQPAHSGDYTVTLSSPGCPSVTDVVTVQVDPLNLISGTVFNDANNNGVQDAGETGIAQLIVSVQPGNYFAYTDSMGNYSIYVPLGSYVVTPVIASYQTSLPANANVGFNGTGQVSSGNNFGVYTTPNQNLSVTLTQVWNAAPGFTTYHRITVKNLGNSPMSGTIRYKRDAVLATLAPNTSAGYTVAGDTLIWNFSNLAPNGTIYRYVYMPVPVTTALGTALSSSAMVTPVNGDVVPANNFFTLNQTVVGSWDPNDKLVQPEGPITIQEAAAGIDLVYTVRFQNTGTAPAVNVMILDTLSDHLDLSTFQMLSGSHSYQLNMRNPSVLEWMFANIMLPDSNANEPESHGYVQYSIRPKTTVSVGDLIENTARIYFDFNEAVVTNTTQTEIGVLNTPATLAGAGLEIYPNPSNGTFRVRLSECQPGAVQVRLINALGQQVHTETAVAGGGTFEHQVQAKNLSQGIYLLQVQQGEKSYTRRVVMQH